MEKQSVVNVNKIKGLRAEHDETQQDVAALLDISVTTYQNKEWGLTEFKPSELKTLAEHWNIEISDLFI